jgi:hypothetical protein
MAGGGALVNGRPVVQLLVVAAAFLGLAGCDDGETVAISGVEARLSDVISTVVVVTWETNIPATGHVEYGATQACELSTPVESEAATSHEAVLLGLTAEQEWSYRVVSEAGGARAETEVASIATGALPAELPVLTAIGGGNDRYIVTPLIGAADAVVILNPEGQYVWYYFDSRGLDIYRARLSLDGQSVIYNAANISGDPAESSEIVRVSLDGEEESSIPIPRLAHDFVELPDGTIGAIAVEYRELGGNQIRGDQIVEATPDGDVSVRWSAWDCFDPEVDVGDDPEAGWTFSNALDYDAEDDAYYLGMRNLSGIVKISRQTGECEFVFGGVASTIEFAAGSSRFLHEHQFEWNGDHVLVFDNDGAEGRVSRVLEYQVDFDNAVAEQTWSYTADPPVFCFVLGDVARLDDGSVFVSWSVAGQLERVSPEGESLWRLNTQLGYAFGFMSLLTDPYGGR